MAPSSKRGTAPRSSIAIVGTAALIVLIVITCLVGGVLPKGGGAANKARKQQFGGGSSDAAKQKSKLVSSAGSGGGGSSNLAKTDVFGDMPKRARSHEETLLAHLFNEHYDPVARAVENVSRTVVVTIDFVLLRIHGLDERSQVLTTTGLVIAEWTDERLTWDPALYGDLTDVIVRSDKIWLPELAVMNGAKELMPDFERIRVLLHSDGRLHWEPGGIFETTCDIDIAYFPFDSQHCPLLIGSYSYYSHRVNISNAANVISTHDFRVNGEWHVYRTSAEWGITYLDATTERGYAHVVFSLYLKRRYKFYIMNIVLPCVMLSVLIMIGFCLPPEAGEKISLGISVLLAFTVFLLMIAESIPKTSSAIPLIVTYLMATMTLGTVSICLTVLILNVHHRGPRYRLSPWLRRFCFVYLARILSVRTGVTLPPDTDRKTASAAEKSFLSSSTTSKPSFAARTGKQQPEAAAAAKTLSFVDVMRKGPVNSVETPGGARRICSVRQDLQEESDDPLETDSIEPETAEEPIWKRRRLSNTKTKPPHQRKERHLETIETVEDVECQQPHSPENALSPLRKFHCSQTISSSLSEIRIPSDCFDRTALSGTSTWLPRQLSEPRRCNGNATVVDDGLSVISISGRCSLPTIDSLAAAAASTESSSETDKPLPNYTAVNAYSGESWLQQHSNRKPEPNFSSPVSRFQAAAGRRGRTFPKPSPASNSFDADVDPPAASTSAFTVRTPLSMLRYLLNALRRFIADPACSFLRRRRRRAASGEKKSNMASLLAAASTRFVVDKRLRDDFRFLDDYGSEAVRKEMMIDDATIVAEWRELARVLDRLFFWVLFGLMTASAIIILLYPKYTGNETGWDDSESYDSPRTAA